MRDEVGGYDRRMFTLPLGRMRRIAWMVLAWLGAVLYPGILFVTVSHGTQGFDGVEILLSAALTGLVAALLIRHPLPVHVILFAAWTLALLEMPNGTVA